jgi:hypothetical protein
MLCLILNESAVTAMSIKGNPVGARLTTPDGDLNARDGSQYIHCCRVGKDFHFRTCMKKLRLYLLSMSEK